MDTILRTAVLAPLAAGLALAPVSSAETYHLFLLAGQSNMDGYGYVSELPEKLTGGVEGALIYTAQRRQDGEPSTGAGVWAALTPGHGVGHTADGESGGLSDRFGPELTFAARLRELHPEERIAIIKYAKGGSSLDVRVAGEWGTWDPHDRRGSGETRGQNQYDHALASIEAATSVDDIDGDGEPDSLIPAGIVWMQGETDGTDQRTTELYAEHLAELAALLRASLRDDDLPFVVGRISDSGQGESGRVWEFGDALRAQQARMVEVDVNAALVTSTDGYDYSDPYHYDTAGYIDLGCKFAEAMDRLRD